MGSQERWAQAEAFSTRRLAAYGPSGNLRRQEEKRERSSCGYGHTEKGTEQAWQQRGAALLASVVALQHIWPALVA